MGYDRRGPIYQNSFIFRVWAVSLACGCTHGDFMRKSCSTIFCLKCKIIAWTSHLFSYFELLWLHTKHCHEDHSVGPPSMKVPQLNRRDGGSPRECTHSAEVRFTVDGGNLCLPWCYLGRIPVIKRRPKIQHKSLVSSECHHDNLRQIRQVQNLNGDCRTNTDKVGNVSY